MVFEVFRKRQKQMIVVLAVVAMFAFVLADLLDRLADSLGQGTDRVLATAWGEEIRASDVAQLQGSRLVANQFIARARQAVGLQMLRPFWETGDSAIIRDLVVLEKARRLGLSVSRAEVTEFINGEYVTDKKLSSTAFRSVLSGRGLGSEGQQPLNVSEQDLYDILATELLISKTVNALTPSASRTTPLELWRSNAPAQTHVALEFARVPVNKFVGDVKPTADHEKELLALYEEHKDQPGRLDEGVIGFQEPRRVQVQYLLVNVDKHLDGVDVTEQEMRKHYDENKTDFREEAKPAAKAEPGDEKAKVDSKQAPAKDAKGDEKAPSKEKASEKQAEPKDEKAKSEPKPAAKEPEKTVEPAKSDASTKPKTEPAEPKKEEAKKAEGSAQIRSLIPVSSISLSGLLLQEEKKADGKVDPKKEEPSKATAKPDTKEASPTRVESSTEPKSVPNEPGADVKKAEASKAAEPAKEQQADAAKSEAKPAEAKPAEPRTKPFEEVKEEIAKILKRRKAGDKLAVKLRAILQETMYKYADAYDNALRQYRAGKPSADLSGFTPPAPPDLEKLAKDNGFELKSTELVTLDQLDKITELSQAERVDDTPAMFSQSFTEVVVRQKPYRGRILRSPDQTRYVLYWKTKDVPARTPKFEEVRDQVELALRQQQAIPLAEAEAKRLAEEVAKAGGDMQKAVKDSGYAIETTERFPRATTQFQSNPFMSQRQLISSTIEQIPGAGEAFLDAVFKLKQGETAVVPDEAKKNFYVVKVKEKVEPDFSRFVEVYTIQRFQQQRQQMWEHQLRMERVRFDICEEAGLRYLTANDETDEPPAEQPTTT